MDTRTTSYENNRHLYNLFSASNILFIVRVRLPWYFDVGLRLPGSVLSLSFRFLLKVVAETIVLASSSATLASNFADFCYLVNDKQLIKPTNIVVIVATEERQFLLPLLFIGITTAAIAAILDNETTVSSSFKTVILNFLFLGIWARLTRLGA